MRGFRDNRILRTYAGSSFMVAFNAWYYSFSPGVAQFIAEHSTVRTGVKFFLYPLMGILRIGAASFHVFPTNPEVGTVLWMLVVSMLTGAVYLALPATAILTYSAKARRIARRLEWPLVVLLLCGLGAVVIAEVSGADILMLVAISGTVLAALMTSTLIVSRIVLRLVKRH